MTDPARWGAGLAALNGALGVALGAFGAHALAGRLDPYALGLIDKASLYLLLHGAAGLGAAALVQAGRARPLWVVVLGLGALAFAGSLALIAFTGLRGLGAVAPLGGSALILAWIMLLIGAFRIR